MGLLKRTAVFALGLLVLGNAVPSSCQELVFRASFWNLGMIGNFRDVPQATNPQLDHCFRHNYSHIVGHGFTQGFAGLGNVELGMVYDKSCIAQWTTSQNSFLVYRTDQIDTRLQSLQSQITQQVNSGLAAAEGRMTSSLQASLQQIPQRLLSEEAKKDIEAAILSKVQAQIDQVRADLQKQIDDLKQKQSSAVNEDIDRRIFPDSQNAEARVACRAPIAAQ